MIHNNRNDTAQVTLIPQSLFIDLHDVPKHLKHRQPIRRTFVLKQQIDCGFRTVRQACAKQQVRMRLPELLVNKGR